MKRGFSASTVILVALLLGVLFWVGKVVNPPTKGGHDDHDEKPASTPAAPSTKPDSPAPTTASGKPAAPPTPMKPNMNTPPTSGGPMGDSKMAAMAHNKPGAHPPAPKSDGMDAAYWQEHDMGAVTAKPSADAH